MNSNPFEGRPNPWSTAAEAIDEAKESTVADITHLAQNVERAKKEGNNLFLLWAKRQIEMVVKNVMVFIKRSIELAIFKFCLELCAMAIKSLMEALTSKGYSAMDVSTKGVVYHGDNPAPGKTQTYSGNPFESTAFSRPW